MKKKRPAKLFCEMNLRFWLEQAEEEEHLGGAYGVRSANRSLTFPRSSRIVEAPAGTVVTQIGEPGDSFCIIIDGAVAVRTPVGTGSELHPGDFFGEMSLLDGEPRSATILATTDLRLLSVDRAHFWRLLDETPDLIRRILTILSHRVRRLEQTVDAILHGTNPA